MGRVYDALRKSDDDLGLPPAVEAVPVFAGPGAPVAPSDEPPTAGFAPERASKMAGALAAELAPEMLGEEIDLEPVPPSRLYSQRRDGLLGAHQLRILQANILEMQGKQPFKRLLITSATAGEGKTHVAANLAWTLALDGERRVLLIDADIENPSVHSVCGIPNEVGLKELLVNGGNPWKTVHKVRDTNLHIMTGGGVAFATIKSASLARFQCVLEQLAPAFDLLIIDSAPPLGGVETKMLSAVADATLLVVRAHTTSRDLVQKAQQFLEGQNILGVVLNDLDPSMPCFNGYYYHGSRSSNGKSGKKK